MVHVWKSLESGSIIKKISKEDKKQVEAIWKLNSGDDEPDFSAYRSFSMDTNRG
jgi:hypothetical protein